MHRHFHGRGSSRGPRTAGHVIDWPRRYDLLNAVFFLGKERRFRQEVLDLARLTPGERVLDVGCGTGTLAIAARERLGPDGEVHGVDPSPEMIEHAREKARRAGLTVDFQVGVIEELPFEKGSFDAVTSTLMFHHLDQDLRLRGLAEVRRVLRPGGRLLVVDMQPGTGLFGRLRDHLAHGERIMLTPTEVAAMMEEAGLEARAGETERRLIGYALGTRPS